MPDRPSGTVTFLFTDIEGSTRLWEQQPQTMPAALARHDALLRQTIETHGGHLFKTIGDGCCAAFAHPADAVTAAIAAQQALEREKLPFRVRMAVHTGAAEYRSGDYFGPALNRVARLLNSGHGGQVLLSATTARQLPPELLAEIDLRSLGVHRLRDIAAREAIFQLLAPGLPAQFPPLNTLDVAFRRGVLRAAAVALVVVAALAGLALTALHQAQRADQNARQEARQRRLAQEGQENLRRHLYASETSLAQRELEAANRPRAEELLLKQQPGPGQEDLRGWEWRYLWRLTREDDSWRTLEPRSGPVISLAYAPDGRTLAALDPGGFVRLYDVATQRERAHLGIAKWGGGGGWAVTFSPDGRLLAWFISPSHLRLWDLRRRREAAVLDTHTGTGASDWFGPVRFSPDGRLMAAGGPDGRVRLWTVAEARALAPIAAHTGPVDSLAFSPDGRLLATSGEDHSVALWNVATRRKVTRLQRLGDSVASLAFSPDGKLLASGASSSGAVSLWDVRTGEMVATLHGSRFGWVWVAFSPDGRQLAGGGADGVLRLWDVAARREIAALAGHQKGITSLVFSPDGKTIASGSNDGTVKLWRPVPKPEELLQGAPGGIFRIAVSPDGKTLASGNRSGLITLWDWRRKRRIGAFKGHTGIVMSLAFSPDGERLASSGEDMQIKVWDVATRHPIFLQSRHEAAAGYPVAFSPDGKLLAWSGDRQEIHLRNIAAKRDEAVLQAHAASVGHLQTLSFSPDGKILAAGYQGEGVVRLWDVARHREIDPLLPGHMGWCGPITFSPDGKHLATVSGMERIVYVWDVATHQRIQTVTGNSEQINWMRFSPDGRTLGTGCGDSMIRLWSTASGSEVAAMNDPNMDFAGTFSRDGLRLFTGNGDGGIRVWRAASPAEADTQSAVVWQQREVDRAEKAKNWPEAVSHLTWLIRTQPRVAPHSIRRGRALLQLGQWSRAAADLARGLALGSDDLDARIDLARAQLAAGNSAGYQKACAALLDRAEAYIDEVPDFYDNSAGACTLAPRTGVSPLRLMRLAEKARALAPHDPGIRTTLGAALYRAGRFDAAVRQLNPNVTRSPQGGTPEDWLFLAMAYHRLGHSDVARRYLARAVQWTHRATRPNAAPPLSWERRLQLRLLRRETEALLGQKTAPAARTEKGPPDQQAGR